MASSFYPPTPMPYPSFRARLGVPQVGNSQAPQFSWDSLLSGANDWLGNHSDRLTTFGAALLSGHPEDYASAMMAARQSDEARYQGNQTASATAKLLQSMAQQYGDVPEIGELASMVENKGISPGEAFSTALSLQSKLRTQDADLRKSKASAPFIKDPALRDAVANGTIMFDDALKMQGSGVTYGYTPLPFRRPDGSIGYGQLGDDGSFHEVQLPNGSTAAPTVTPVNQGTQFGGVNKFGDVINLAVPINNSQAEFDKSIGGGNAKNLLDQQGAAQDAVTSLQSTQEALSLLNSGVITGFGADFKLGLGKALQQVGFHGADDAIANTEAYVAQRVQETGRLIKMFGSGTGLSDADRAYAAKAAAGQISLDEASIRKILEINQRAAQNVISRFNSRLQDVGTNGGGLGSMAVNPPAVGAGGSMLPDPLGMMGR